MSRVKKLIDTINEGVVKGAISEQEKKQFMNTQFNSKEEFSRLEETVCSRLFNPYI